MKLEEANFFLQVENEKYHEHFQDVPKDDWARKWEARIKPFRVLRNRHFLVQVFKESGILRVSVNRTRLKEIGRWDDKITWDELQEIKSKLGYGEFDAVEIFPRDEDVVNVANMRHLWILTKATLPFIWRKES